MYVPKILSELFSRTHSVTVIGVGSLRRQSSGGCRRVTIQEYLTLVPGYIFSILKKLIHRNILPTDPNKKIKLIIYYNKFKTSNLVIRNNSSPSIGVLQKTNAIYKFKCPLGHCISDNNNIYVGLTSTTLSRRLTMHFSYTSSIAQHLKKHSCPTTQLRKILTDNTTILEHQNNKQKLQILEALHIRNMQPTLNRINFQTSANVLNCL